MNKSAIQKYAIWARNELIEQVKQRAFQYGISETGFGDENASIVAGRVLSSDEKRQRKQFIEVIKRSTYQQTIEEVAYTWFNRFIALRYMEVNDYLPTHVRVFSDASGNFKPEILSNVLHIDLPGLDKDKVSEFLNSNQTQELYRYLLLTQCNALNELLPEMFERLGAYTEMLLPNNILKPEGVIGRLVNDIPEEDFKDAVQIIGWMYQYYNTEPKQEVFDGLKKNIKITKEKIPAATQLFTPDWIVRYMVENSLGRLWLDSHPNSKLRDGWKYYIDEAEQTPEVNERLQHLRTENAIKSPEDIKFIDPCMGSGHILVYAFDVLMQIYESEGYNSRDAVRLIIEKNIYGLDIDRRAYQLTYFALMMKARQYNRRIFAEKIKPQVYYPVGYPDGKEYGSLVKVEKLQLKPVEKSGQLSIEDTEYELHLNSWNFKSLLVQKYDVVVTNPPYMADRGMNAKHLNYISKNYSHGKIDLFAAFMIRCGELVKNKGFIAMITQQAWMFLSSFENLRKDILSKYVITNMAHLGNGAFGFADFGLTSFVLYAGRLENYQGTYARLVNDSNPEWKEREFLNNKSRFYAYIDNYVKIPGMPIAYWLGHNWITIFNNQKLNQVSTSKAGVVTGDDSYFVRLWFEPNVCDIDFVYNEVKGYGKYHIMQKGGFYRKYYGCNEYVIRLADLYDNTRTNKSVRRGDKNAYFQKVIGWSLVGMNYEKSFRLIENAVCGTATPTIMIDNSQLLYYSLGLLNSKMANVLMNMFNPTINLQSTNVGNIPLIRDKDKEKYIIEIVENNINISKGDWDAFETSWDFDRHPLICDERTVEVAFSKWDCKVTERFDTLRVNEQELNRIFIDIYGLHDELTPEIEDKDVTVRKADLEREVCSLISYAVGCMFGRYSLDSKGLIYAGGEWDVNKYQNFPVDNDNIIPILDDEYFEDDILGRFVSFIKTVYGEDTLEENLKFIADTLGGKGAPREIIRDYFLNDFYADHLKIYQKRPIYWMFDSGKKNGFKALIYMHRYSRDLLAKLRTDYVHEQQERYRTQLSRISSELNHALGTERSKLLKQQDKLTEQLKEITVFEEKVHHLADQHIEIDLDDGVKKNYALFEDVLAKI